MKVYVGDVIRKAIHDEAQPIPKTRIAALLGISRSQFYNLINSLEMDMEYVNKIGKILRKDFSGEINALNERTPDLMFQDGEKLYLAQVKVPDSKDEMLEMQRKYIHALEDIIRLKRELSECQKQLKEQPSPTSLRHD